MLDKRVHLIREYLTEQFPDKLLSHGFLQDPEDLTLAHDPKFVKNLFENPEQEVIKTFELVKADGSYHRYRPEQASKSLDQIITPHLYQVEGTLCALKSALSNGFGFHVGGGLHHATIGQGRGFCLINDIVIALRKLQKTKQIEQAWIIDVDAHKGDGTAEITQNDETLNTLSIHMGEAWPLDEDDPLGHFPSDIDIPIPPNSEDSYLPKLEAGLHQLKTHFPRPDVALVVQGADPYEKDELPSSQDLQLTKEQMLQRDLLVYNFLKEAKIPQAYVISGGYGNYAHEIYIQFLEAIKSDLS